MGILDDVKIGWNALSGGWKRRRNREMLFDALESHEPMSEGKFVGAIYFPDTARNLYQIRQWYEPMRELAQQYPLFIICRSAKAARIILEESGMPVFFARWIREVEEYIGKEPIKIVFYVNQNMKNFQMIGYPSPAHVHISHGESDKISMASNHLKAYDYAFIAGDASFDRITRNVINIDPNKLVKIGRPQVDVEKPGPELPQDDRTVVLYSPTWEADRPGMAYGSVLSHGEDILASLLANRQYRVIYRPHPRTGSIDSAYKAAHIRLTKMIKAANAADPDAHHLADTESQFGWQLRAADLCICDISAVAFDWLPTGKPLIMTKPVSEEAVVDPNGISRAIPLIDQQQAAQVNELVAQMLSGEVGDDYHRLAHYYFGDTTPGVAMKRFLDASRQVIEQRKQEQAKRLDALGQS